MPFPKKMTPAEKKAGKGKEGKGDDKPMPPWLKKKGAK